MRGILRNKMQRVVKAHDTPEHAIGGDSYNAANKMFELDIRQRVVKTAYVVVCLGEGGYDECTRASPMHVDAAKPMRTDVRAQVGVVAGLAWDGVGDKGPVVQRHYGAFLDQ